MSTEDEITTESLEIVVNPKDTILFKPKPPSKIIRVLTVLAYVLSVSMAAILLSIYYMFMWDGQARLGGNVEAYTANNDTVTIKYVSINETIMMEMNLTTTPSSIIVDAVSTEKEMQKQITALQEDKFDMGDDLFASETTTTEENITWPDYNYSSEFDFNGRSTFIKKLMYNRDPYDEND